MKVIARKNGEIVAKCEIGENVICIGRSRRNDLVLADVGVSRRHAKLYRTDATVTLEDLGSANGIKLKGSPITKVSMNVGDEVEIGPFRISIESDDHPEDSFADAIAVRPKADLPVLRTFLTSDPQAEAGEYTGSTDIQVADAEATPMDHSMQETTGRLVRLDGQNAGQEIPLEKPEITLGSAPTSDVVIDDPQVAQTHARIEKNDSSTFLVKDDPESTGTFIDGVPIRDRELESHDIIHIGSSRFEFLQGSARSQIARQGVIERKPSSTSMRVKLAGSRFSNFITSDWRILLLTCFIIGLLASLIWPRPHTPVSPSSDSTMLEEAERNRLIRNDLAKAEELFKQRRFDEAEARVRRVLKLSSSQNPDALKLERQLDTIRKSEEKKRAEIIARRRREQKELRQLLEDASILQDKGKLDAAETLFKKALAISPKNPQALSALRELNEMRAQKRAQPKDSKKTSSQISALYRSGINKLDGGDFEGAKRDLSKVAMAKGHPNQSEAARLVREIQKKADEQAAQLLSEVNVFINEGDLVSAREALANILKKHPNHAKAITFKEDLDVQLEERAKRVFQEGIAYQELAEDPKAALDRYEEVLRLVPDASNPYHQKAQKKLREVKSLSSQP